MDFIISVAVAKGGGQLHRGCCARKSLPSVNGKKRNFFWLECYFKVRTINLVLVSPPGATGKRLGSSFPSLPLPFLSFFSILLLAPTTFVPRYEVPYGLAVEWRDYEIRFDRANAVNNRYLVRREATNRGVQFCRVELQRHSVNRVSPFRERKRSTSSHPPPPLPPFPPPSPPPSTLDKVFAPV